MDADPMDQEPVLDADLVRLVRAASGEAPSPARRAAIADGAWERARVLRAARRPLPRFVRPLGVAVAAALLMGLGLFSYVGRSGTALAVEGDPVEMWKGGDWQTGSRVETDRWVFTPAGSRRVRLADGSALQPSPGSVFIVRRRLAAGGLPFHVEVRSGRVSYDGDPLLLTVSDVDVTPAGDDGIHLVISSDGDARSRPQSPEDVRVASGSSPRVAVRFGSVLVRTRDSDEILRLGENEAATLFGASTVGGTRRLTLVRSWSSGVVGDVMRGKLVTDAAPTERGGLMVLLAGRRPETIEIDPADRATAVRELNQAMTLCESFVTSFGLRIDQEAPGPLRWALPANPRVSIQVSIGTAAAALCTEEREYVFEQNGETATLYVRRDGTCQLEQDGGVTEFTGVAHFARLQPELAQRMGLADHR